MNVFWRFGYEHTSLDVLMREMGIAKQSLYDTFGDKRALYLKALRQYRDNDHARLRRLFASGQPVKDGFAKILFGISSESREEHERGCLLLSANMERDAKDKVIAEFLLDNQLKTEAIFTEALQRAQAIREVSARHDPAALARFFVAMIQGMRAMAKLNSNRQALEQVAKLALSTLGSQGVGTFPECVARLLSGPTVGRLRRSPRPRNQSPK